MTREKITVKTNPKLYSKWARMRRVCFSVSCDDYEYYGRLGISICPEWNNYENFYYWALDNGYSDELCLTRKDKTKEFSPDNCKWNSFKEVNSNRINNRLLICPKTGKKQTLTDWASELKISVGTLSKRLSNMSIEKALTSGHLNQKTGKPRSLRRKWNSLKRRLNVNGSYYKDVTICDSWLCYSNFEKWAYDNGYREYLLLGRKDTLKDYCPENCYWTTRQGINRNSKKNVKIYYNGEVLCQVEVAEKLEIASSTLHGRLESDVTTSKKLFHKGKIR